MADAWDLGSHEETRESSNLSARTKLRTNSRKDLQTKDLRR